MGRRGVNSVAGTHDRDYRAEANDMALRDYPFEVRKTEFDTYFISVTDLPGCTTEGETLQEAIDQLDDAKIVWIAAALKSGKTIPDPSGDEAYSGKFVARIGKSTHRKIAAAAQRDGVSLNAWLVEAISFRLGYIESGQPATVATATLETKMVFAPLAAGNVIEMAAWKMNPKPSKVNQC